MTERHAGLRTAHISLLILLLALFCLPAAAYTLDTRTAPLTGLWGNSNESGWGLTLTQQGPIVFVAWYTFDRLGAADWYVMSNCAISDNACNGEIYHVSGGTPPALPWNSSSKVVTAVGTATLSFSDDNTALMSYVLNGASGSKGISRQTFTTGTTPPVTNYSAVWWNPRFSR